MLTPFFPIKWSFQVNFSQGFRWLWLEEHYPAGLFIDLLHPGILREYQAFPERLYDVAQAAQSKTIIIDEIQMPTTLIGQLLVFETISTLLYGYIHA